MEKSATHTLVLEISNFIGSLAFLVGSVLFLFPNNIPIYNTGVSLFIIGSFLFVVAAYVGMRDACVYYRQFVKGWKRDSNPEEERNQPFDSDDKV